MQAAAATCSVQNDLLVDLARETDGPEACRRQVQQLQQGSVLLPLDRQILLRQLGALALPYGASLTVEEDPGKFPSAEHRRAMLVAATVALVVFAVLAVFLDILYRRNSK